MSKRNTILFGSFFSLIAFLAILFLDLPTLGGKLISFPSTYKHHEVILKGTYWEVNNAEYAVLVCPGYSCDRQKWRPFSDLFVANGFTTMIFDYAGQGASTGTIGFDNAKTDAIPVEIGDAIEKLHELSGIDYDHIILVGHSLGGRSVLRLLYDYNANDADTKVQKRPIGNIIAFSPSVNYYFNAQASLFARTSDEVEEPWYSFNETWTKGTNVYLYGSTADDIVNDEDVLAMYKHLGGTKAPESGLTKVSETNHVGSRISVTVASGLLHSYMMYSPKYGAFINEALSEITGNPMHYDPRKLSLVYVGWISGLLGLFFLLYGFNKGESWEPEENLPILIDEKQFLLYKLLLWLPGLLAATLICTLCVAVPFGSPVMNIPYMCSIAGYGIIMLFAYRKGAFKGTTGKLPKVFQTIGHFDRKAYGIGVALCFLVWFVMRGTMYRLIPLNTRIFWVVVASLLMTIGYYISGVENDMMDKAEVSRKTRILYNLIQYVALFLLVLFYLVLKSYSGLIGQIQNMILMYIFCIPLGDYIKKRTGSRLQGALVTAFLFQTLMITSAALISMF